MPNFKRSGKKEMPELGTSSDIVFMFLFFFMVTSQLRSTEVKVRVRLPEATEVAKLERKDLASYIYIGSPTAQYQSQYGTEARIQLNDSFKTTNDIRDFIAAERDAMSEADRQLMQVSIKADLLKWEAYPVAMAPDQDYDHIGCFSGSAVEADGKHVLLYTGVSQKDGKEITFLK